jgi:hypothetical protein
VQTGLLSEIVITKTPGVKLASQAFAIEITVGYSLFTCPRVTGANDYSLFFPHRHFHHRVQSEVFPGDAVDFFFSDLLDAGRIFLEETRFHAVHGVEAHARRDGAI